MSPINDRTQQARKPDALTAIRGEGSLRWLASCAAGYE